MTILNIIFKIGLLLLIFYIIYKTNIINNIYIGLHKLMGITENKRIEDNKRKKYIRKMLKNMRHNEEI